MSICVCSPHADDVHSNINAIQSFQGVLHIHGPWIPNYEWASKYNHYSIVTISVLMCICVGVNTTTMLCAVCQSHELLKRAKCIVREFISLLLLLLLLLYDFPFYVSSIYLVTIYICSNLSKSDFFKSVLHFALLIFFQTARPHILTGEGDVKCENPSQRIPPPSRWPSCKGPSNFSYDMFFFLIFCRKKPFSSLDVPKKGHYIFW